ARARGRVIDLNLLTTLEMVGDDVTHDERHFMRRVELPCLLTCVGRELLDEILVDVAEHVITLLAVGGDVIDKVQQLLDGSSSGSVSSAQLRQAGLKGVEDVLEDMLALWSNVSLERG